MKIGIRVICAVCGDDKQPVGRSAPMGPSYCTDECPGYRQAPHVGSLWPGETEEQFGYPVQAAGTQEVEEGTPR